MRGFRKCQKIAKKLTFWGSFSLRKAIVLGAFSKLWTDLFTTTFTPLNGHVRSSSHHKTNQHVWIDHFSHKNHQNWSIETEIRAIFLIEATRNTTLVALNRKSALISVSLDQFWWFLWLKWSIHAYIHFVMTRMLLVKISMVKMMKNHEKCLGESISGSLD